jgi:hypothetical protein
VPNLNEHAFNQTFNANNNVFAVSGNQQQNYINNNLHDTQQQSSLLASIYLKHDA